MGGGWGDKSILYKLKRFQGFCWSHNLYSFLFKAYNGSHNSENWGINFENHVTIPKIIQTCLQFLREDLEVIALDFSESVFIPPCVIWTPKYVIFHLNHLHLPNISDKKTLRNRLQISLSNFKWYSILSSIDNIIQIIPYITEVSGFY